MVRREGGRGREEEGEEVSKGREGGRKEEGGRGK